MLPSHISPESLPEKFNEFFVCKIEEIRGSFGPDRPIPINYVEFYCTVLAEFKTLASTQVKRSPWMHILNTCTAFCSVSCSELEKISAPSCPLMLPTNLLFLSFFLG